MLKGILAIKIVCYLAITFSSLTTFVLSGRLNLPWPEQNKPHERPLHANENTPKLHGLSDHGKAIEKRLEDRLKIGELNPTQIGEARVQMMFREKNTAEHQRNRRHLNGLYQKKRIRKESGTFLGRKNLWSDRVMERYKLDKEEKKGFNKTLRDIANDTKVHKKLHTIGDKDAKYINKTKWKDSHAYGYDTDGNSKGSSFGYRSRSPSPNNEVERPRRDDTPPPSPVKSSSTISPLPSLSLTKYSTTSSSSDDSSGGTFSTATSKRKPKKSIRISTKCSLHPDLYAYSASANETHPNHPRLSETGKEVERSLAKSLHPRPNEITYAARHIPRLRFNTLTDKARNAEQLRNFWHEEKNRLDHKLERKNRSIRTKVGKTLGKIPGTIQNNHKYARGKRDSYKAVLKDISKDSAVHKELGHLNSNDERNINAIKHEKSRQLGYTSEGSPRSPNANPNAVYIDDLRSSNSHTSP